jgi:AcrR family transcriptional regulator
VTEEPDRLALPPSIALAWGLRVHPRRGPKPGLTLDRIVAAGIKVALTEGLAGVSMARVAGELGVATMSLYRYVSAKDDLLSLMVDAAIGLPPRAEHPDEDWRAGLTRWAEGVRAAYRRHLWALRVPIAAPPIGPNNIAWLEAALRTLGTTQLSEAEKLRTVLLLSFFVRSEVTLTADVAAASGSAPPDFGYSAMLGMLTDAAHFPALHRAIAAGAFDDDDDHDAYFNYGLGRILDGVGRLATRTASSW